MMRMNVKRRTPLTAVCTNQAKEYSPACAPRRDRHSPYIAGAYLLRYAQVTRVAALATKRGKSVDFISYWQGHVEP
jgi:hypothetical protein